jgi:HEAT repeat protein
VSAIALHEGAAADSALDALTTAPQPESIRRKAVFWLGNARGRHGYETLTRILRDDPSDKVREHAIFALTQSKEPGAIETMVKIAHEDRSAHVRGQALFWLAHTAQRKIAADEIARAVDNDPQTEVKKRAVFALSQLPNGEGVPKLIDLAKTNRNAEVRKQAMFWLGQSKDPRALDFFQQVLSH